MENSKCLRKACERFEHAFFTSDTHFNHENVIRFCNRPFESIEQHDETLIDNWNRVVGKNDVVFHLGDVAFGTINKWEQIIPRLNGKIHLIMGNHDIRNVMNQTRLWNLFESVQFQKYISIADRQIILNHFPFLAYGGTYRDVPVIQLYGHVHSGPRCTIGRDIPRLVNTFACQYDVGVDNNEFTPVSFEQILTKMASNATSK